MVNRGISTAELAHQTGFTAEHAKRVLSRQVPPSREFALAVAREFDLGLDEVEVLVGGRSSWVPGWTPSRRAALRPTPCNES